MKRAIALSAILVIILLVEVAVQFENVEANPYMFLQFTRIKIYSPQYHVYVYPYVDISFDYYVENDLPQVDTFSYCLDGNANSTLASSKSSISQINFTMYSVFKTLENLSNSNHKLTVYASFSNKTVKPLLNTTVVVDTTYIQPTPVMISPLNQTTYPSKDVPITYIFNAKIISSSYTFDTSDFASKWTEFNGNITLTDLSEGSHKLRLSLVVQPHSGVQYGHHYETIYFNVGSNDGNSTSTATLGPNASQPISLDEPAPLITPSTIAPSENYSIPPLSSLKLKVGLNHGLGPLGGCGGLVYIKGGDGNDINFRVLDPQGKTILDLGRISNEKEFYVYPDETGDFTIILDNEFSVLSSKEVNVFSYSYPNNLFEFGGFSINFWAIILVVIAIVLMVATVAVIVRHRKSQQVKKN